MLWPTSSSLRRPQWLIILPCFVFLLLVPLLVFRTAAFQRLDTWLSHSTRPQKAAAAPPSDTVETGSPQTTTNGSPQNETTQSEFYEWRTRSAFRPVRQSGVADKSVEELCASFPKHLLDEVQPALKTGHGVIDSRVRPQLQSVSACLTNLLIFSDLDEECEGHQVIDVIADLPADHIEDNDQLGYYRSLRDLTANGSLAEADAVSRKGWQIDKFKFLAAVSRAWRMRPERRWYVFYEADTYMVWDNMFRLLENFDPDTPLYFGSPSPGRDDMWFGNGGPGYVISREAMRRLVKYDWDATTGEYQGSKLTERHWDELMHNCCGDSVVGWALWTEKVKLSGLWPMFNPHPPHGVPFSDLYWCQPVITMHKPHEDDILGLWRWQWEHRELTRPLTYRDLALSYFNVTALETRQDWDNADWDAFGPPIPSRFYSLDPHASIESCAEACKAHAECFQWTYHLRKCTFVRSIRVGRHREPEVGKGKTEEEKAREWDVEDLRFVAGWAMAKVQEWAEERPCEQVEWVRPSITRIF